MGSVYLLVRVSEPMDHQELKVELYRAITGVEFHPCLYLSRELSWDGENEIHDPQVAIPDASPNGEGLLDMDDIKQNGYADLMFLVLEGLVELFSGLFVKMLNTIYVDLPTPWALGFQDIGSPTFYGLVELHDHILFYLVIILVLVSWFLVRGMLMNNAIVYTHHFHGHLIEFLWTLAPALILGAIAIPSFRLLYLMDEIVEPELTVKAVGNQWYWSYEYTDYADPIQFDSFLVEGPVRQLNVDNYMVLPVDTSVRLLVTSTDVIHSFAVPSLGIKLDAMPGRLNSVGFMISRPGVFYGQCSELCGYLHAFMPIGIKAVSMDQYFSWLASN